MEKMDQEGSFCVHCSRVYMCYILPMKKCGFGFACWCGVKFFKKYKEGFFLPSCQTLQSTYSNFSSPKLHLTGCHVMSMIYEYGLSTSHIRWSKKQVNLWVSEEKCICLWYRFLSKVLYLKCWNNFSRTPTVCCSC